jgi:hypothetical protein
MSSSSTYMIRANFNLQAAPQACCCTFDADNIRLDRTATSVVALVPSGGVNSSPKRSMPTLAILKVSNF